MKTGAKQTLDIAIAVPGLQFNGNTFSQQSLGGSESAAYYLARAFAVLGHRVTVFCNTEPVRCADVDYLPLALYRQYAEYTQHDVSIVQRDATQFSPNSKARLSVLWCHDLAVKRHEPMVAGMSWCYDRLAVLSRFMLEQYQQVYGLDPAVYFLTRNGVDLATVAAVRAALTVAAPDAKRNPYALCFSARPERGLDVLLSEVFPRILQREPRARLFLSEYANPVEHLREFYAQCRAMAARLGDRVQVLGNLTKSQLYEVYLAAGLYVYPVPSLRAPEFDEVSPVHGGTVIETVAGPKKIRDLEGQKGFYVYSRRPNGTLGASRVNGVWRTRKNAKVITLVMRPGAGRKAKEETTLTLTPDHEVMLKDGTYKRAGLLVPGDRVMFVRSNYDVRKGMGYQDLRITGGLPKYGHRIVVESVFLGRGLFPTEIVHHKDGDPTNNDPSNLEVTSHSEHIKEHWREKTDEQRLDENSRRSLTSKRVWGTAAGRESRRKSGKVFWSAFLDWPEERKAQWLRWREGQKRTHGCADKAVLAKNGKKTFGKMWAQINALPAPQRAAWLSARAKKMRSARWGQEVGENHVVVAIISAPSADVFCMEVEPDHNFIANGVVVHNCLSVMEAQACGLPVVASARGALPETLAPGAGVLVPEEVHTPAYYDAFVDAAVRLMNDDDAWTRASQMGVERAATLDWSRVAEQWTEMFYEEIRKFSADRTTLANHFWRRSDIYAAREVLRSVPTDDAKSVYVRERVAQDWAFIDAPDGFRTQYERIGATHDPRVIDWSPGEPRYTALRAWLFKKITEGGGAPLSVLDYGCAHGGYAVNLLKELPALRVTGVDIDLHGIEMACGFAEQRGVAERWRGVVGGHERLTDQNVPEMCECYDVVLAQEVLEHVEDPRAVLAALEERVRDGGTVYATVPFGPWEYTDYKRYPHRAHVREFDLHDLHDLLDGKGKDGDVTISVMPYGREPYSNEALGWYVVQYTVTANTRSKLGAIDMERKLWLQRPRQTLTAMLMVGGAVAEETLLWCLRSLEHVADEVIVADCGLTPTAKAVMAMSELSDGRLRVIPAPDPKQHGFETPRNLALAQAAQDWVLWIDTDEKLLQAENVTKYLRANSFQGYSIRQHHFAVDTHFDADLPVRMFRNNGRLRFFGMVHEHPESAINEGPGRTIVLSDVHIPHVGYLVETGRQVKFGRNLPMLEADIAKYPQRKLQKHFIMRDKMLLVAQALRHNGMQLTDDLRQQCRDVIALYREYFLGKGHFTNTDPIVYYSQAVALLSEGVDVAFTVAADKIDAKPNGGLKVRFASTEDALTEITHRARAAIQPFEARYW